jgi:hypothetical protein
MSQSRKTDSEQKENRKMEERVLGNCSRNDVVNGRHSVTGNEYLPQHVRSKEDLAPPQVEKDVPYRHDQSTDQAGQKPFGESRMSLVVHEDSG